MANSIAPEQFDLRLHCLQTYLSKLLDFTILTDTEIAKLVITDNYRLYKRRHTKVPIILFTIDYHPLNNPTIVTVLPLLLYFLFICFFPYLHSFKNFKFHHQFHHLFAFNISRTTATEKTTMMCFNIWALKTINFPFRKKWKTKGVWFFNTEAH